MDTESGRWSWFVDGLRMPWRLRVARLQSAHAARYLRAALAGETHAPDGSRLTAVVARHLRAVRFAATEFGYADGASLVAEHCPELADELGIAFTGKR